MPGAGELMEVAAAGVGGAISGLWQVYRTGATAPCRTLADGLLGTGDRKGTSCALLACGSSRRSRGQRGAWEAGCSRGRGCDWLSGQADGGGRLHVNRSGSKSARHARCAATVTTGSHSNASSLGGGGAGLQGAAGAAEVGSRSKNVLCRASRSSYFDAPGEAAA